MPAALIARDDLKPTPGRAQSARPRSSCAAWSTAMHRIVQIVAAPCTNAVK
jgi:hypothetical protein